VEQQSGPFTVVIADAQHPHRHVRSGQGSITAGAAIKLAAASAQT
jgi:hypothetical protein